MLERFRAARMESARCEALNPRARVAKMTLIVCPRLMLLLRSRRGNDVPRFLVCKFRVILITEPPLVL